MQREAAAEQARDAAAAAARRVRGRGWFLTLGFRAWVLEYNNWLLVPKSRKKESLFLFAYVKAQIQKPKSYNKGVSMDL